MWALSGARLAGGSVADVVVDGDRIARIRPEASAGVPEVLDCSGRLVLPAFVDGHVHLDKVLIRDELSEHDGTLSGAIEAIHERKRRYSRPVQWRTVSREGPPVAPMGFDRHGFVARLEEM